MTLPKPTADRAVWVLAFCCAALLVASLTTAAVHEPRHEDLARAPVTEPVSPQTATSTVAPTTTSTTLGARPPELLFTVARGPYGQAEQPPAAMAVAPDGRSLHAVPEAPTVPLVQLAAGTGDMVSTRSTVQSTSGPHTGCGFAGCSTSYSSQVEQDILLTPRAGPGPRSLTTGGGDDKPVFSPDGTKIAFYEHISRGQGTADNLTIIDTSGNVVDRIEPPEGVDWTRSRPTWSPDGSQIAVTASDGRSGSQELLILSLDGSPMRVLATGTYWDPAWSHDGSSIAVAWQFDDLYAPFPRHGPDLYVIGLAGSVRRLTTYAKTPYPSGVGYVCGVSGGWSANVSSPLWSPDDSSIAFLTTMRHQHDVYPPFDIMVVNRDGSGLHAARPATPNGCDRAKGNIVDDVHLLGWLPSPQTSAY